MKAKKDMPIGGLNARETMVVAATFCHGKKGVTVKGMVPLCVLFEHWAMLSPPVRKKALAILKSSTWLKRFQKKARSR